MGQVGKYKFYFRKSSFKKNLSNADILLKLISYHKPRNFLEVGVLEGVTARNVCELLSKIHIKNFIQILHSSPLMGGLMYCVYIFDTILSWLRN